MYFLIGSLAVWRLVKMLQEDIGPLALFYKLRNFIDKLKYTNGGIREGFYCLRCMSICCGILFMIIFLISPILFYITAIPLAYSAIAIFIETKF